MLTRKAVILAKIETTYGADPAPTAADNAILCSVPQITPKGDVEERDFVRSTLSPIGHVVGMKEYEIKFTCELKGSGAAGTAPEIGPLLRACGLDETVVATTSVKYLPLSTGFESVTIYFYRDGLLHKLTGARGTFDLDLEVGKFGKINFTFSGIYAPASDAAMVNGTYNAIAPPQFFDAGLTIGGYAPIFTRLNLSMGNTVTRREDANTAGGVVGFEITARKPTGSLDPEAVTLATKDFWSVWENGTKQALACTAGATAGNKCTIAAPKTQLTDLSYGDRNGIVTYDIPFTCTYDNGDDEISFLFE